MNRCSCDENIPLLTSISLLLSRSPALPLSRSLALSLSCSLAPLLSSLGVRRFLFPSFSLFLCNAITLSSDCLYLCALAVPESVITRTRLRHTHSRGNVK